MCPCKNISIMTWILSAANCSTRAYTVQCTSINLLPNNTFWYITAQWPINSWHAWKVTSVSKMCAIDSRKYSTSNDARHCCSEWYPSPSPTMSLFTPSSPSCCTMAVTIVYMEWKLCMSSKHCSIHEGHTTQSLAANGKGWLVNQSTNPTSPCYGIAPLVSSPHFFLLELSFSLGQLPGPAWYLIPKWPSVIINTLSWSVTHHFVGLLPTHLSPQSATLNSCFSAFHIT